jgi:hypothetical protein
MIFVERRRAGFTAELLWPVGLIWLAVAVLFLITKWPAITAMQLHDADDTLRLIQLRDLVAGQNWLDLTQHRANPPGGLALHWSRLVDVPLWLIYSAFAPLLGPALAETMTVILVPLLTLYCAMLLAGRLAWRMLGGDAAGDTCLVMALMTAVIEQMQPLRIDHHGWQIVAVLAALNGLAARCEKTGGRLAGIAMALGLTISLELLPIAALIGAVLALRWLRDRKDKALCLHYIRTLAVTALLAFGVTRGLGDLAPHCDTLSPAYIAALLTAASGLSLLGLAPPMPRPALALVMAAIAAGGVATLVLLAPQCSSGPFVALDPLVQQFWYANVREGMPVWRQDLSVALRLVVPPLFGLIAAIRLWQSSNGWLRRFWFEYTLILAGALLLGLVVSRSTGFAAAIGAVPLSWMLREWIRAGKAMRPGPKRIGLFAAAMLVVLPQIPLEAARALQPQSSAPAQTAQYICDIQSAATTLKTLPPVTIFAPIDTGPMLLLHTPHKVVATAHHRAPQALHDVIAAFTANPAKAEAIVRGRGARYVAICPGLAEAAIYREAAPQGLMAKLSAGQVPSWLKPVTMPKDSGLLVWEVVQP